MNRRCTSTATTTSWPWVAADCACRAGSTPARPPSATSIRATSGSPSCSRSSIRCSARSSAKPASSANVPPVPVASSSPLRRLRPHRKLPARPDEMAGVAVGNALQIVLVLGLGFPEVGSLGHLGHDLAGPQAGGLDVGDGVLGNATLLIAGIEDRRAVAGAEVVALAVECR